jgi:hypothetical protein
MPLIETNKSYEDIIKEYESMAPMEQGEIEKRTQKTISDLREDDNFLQKAEIALGWLGENISKPAEIGGFGSLDAKSDPIEAIRDSQWNTIGMSSLAWNINDAPDDVKEAWAYIREEYANADTRGLIENAEALWDVGVDLISDPATLGAIIATPLTFGGAGAANVATRAGLMAVAKASLGKLAGVASGEMTKSVVKNGMIAGTGYGLLDSHTRQNTDMAIGLQDQYSYLDLGLSGGAGGALGAGTAVALPAVMRGGAKITREFFENINKDKAIARIGDNVDHPESSMTSPESDQIVNEILQTWTENNAVPKNFRSQVAGKFDLSDSEANEVLTSIFEIQSKAKRTPEDTATLNEIKKSFDLTSDDIDDIATDYVLWRDTENNKIPSGFVNEFVAKWTPFSDVNELNRNRNFGDSKVENDISFIMQTGGRKKITKQEQEALNDILDEYDLEFNDYKEMLDDIAIYKMDNPTPEQISNRQLAEKTAAKLGAGDETADEIEGLLDGIVKDPSKKEVNLRKASSIIHRGAGNMYMGRATSRLKPYAKASESIKKLVQLFRYDTHYKDITNTSTTVERVGKDFYETFSTLRAGWGSRVHSILDDAAFNYNGALSSHNQKIIVDSFRGAKIKDEAFQNQDKGFRLNPFTNDRLLNKGTTKIIVDELKSLFDEMGTELLNRGIISTKEANYFPRMWDAVAIKENGPQFQKLLMDEIGLSKNDALKVHDNMLKNSSDDTLSNAHGSHFFYNRKLDIKDESKFAEFLEQDLPSVVFNYIDVASRAIAKQDIFGVRTFRTFGKNKNIKTFENTWLPQIKKELIDSGVTEGEINRLTRGRGTAGTEGYKPGEIENLWRHITGEGTDPVGSKWRLAQDVWTVAGRTALLPLITVTSLTEPLINIAKAGPKHALYGFVDSLGTITETMAVNFGNKLAREYKYKPPEVWRELEKVGSIMTTSMNQMSQRTGDRNIQGVLGKANYHFFRGVLVDQWTKFVQLVSHNTAKRLIKENLDALHSAGVTRVEPKLKNKKLQRQQAELLELDIDVEEGINWIKNGSNIKDNFWQEGIVSNIPRYVREVIIPTEKSAGTTPIWHNNPSMGWLFDLLSYPAAFSNTVLAEFANKAIRNKVETGVTASTLATFAIMTGVARFGNYVRTRGESEDYEDKGDIYFEALKRWGALGPAEPIYRGAEAWKYSRNITSLGTALIGPTGSDISRIAQRGTLLEAFGQTRVPGIQLLRTLSPEGWENYVKMLRGGDKSIRELAPELDPRYTRGGRAKGGEVYDVPQVPEEPDERIDKMTGLPYDQQAGGAFVDEEDRLEFGVGGKLGGKASKIVSNFISTYTDDIAKNRTSLLQEAGESPAPPYATGGKVLGSLARTQKATGGKILSSLNKVRSAA